MNTNTTDSIEILQKGSPSLFITVPTVTLPSGVVVPAFDVGQYFCAKDADGCAIVSATAKPWVRINYHAARAACAAAGTALLTELQALAIAYDIVNQGANWTSGVVGEGALKQGLRNDSVDRAQAGDFVPKDPAEDRWFVLSNGSRICDAAGNIFSWLFDDVQGDAFGLTTKAFSQDSLSLATAPHAPMTHGIGRRPRPGTDRCGGAPIRGGCWRSGPDAGVFSFSSAWPYRDYGYLGFRCTKQ